MELRDNSQEKKYKAKWILFLHFCFYELVYYWWITLYCSFLFCIFLMGIFWITWFIGCSNIFTSLHLSGKF